MSYEKVTNDVAPFFDEKLPVEKVVSRDNGRDLEFVKDTTDGSSAYKQVAGEVLVVAGDAFIAIAIIGDIQPQPSSTSFLDATLQLGEEDALVAEIAAGMIGDDSIAEMDEEEEDLVETLDTQVEDGDGEMEELKEIENDTESDNEEKITAI